MAIKVNKEEWLEFQKWLKEKGLRELKKSLEEREKKKTSEIPEEEIELVDEIVEEIEEEEEEEEYVCGNCDFKSNREFEICPKCGKKLVWE